MEKLEAQKDILTLGKLLVEQLDLNKSVDTLGRWMAHYIAEKIHLAENAVGIEQEAAKKDCFKVILEFWEHRWDVQKELRPLGDFEPILKLIRDLDPDAEEEFYFNFNKVKKAKVENEYLDIAKRVDKSARISIYHLLLKAAEAESTPISTEILQVASSLAPSPDRTIISSLFDKNNYDFDPSNFMLENTGFNEDYQTSKLEQQIKSLEDLLQQVSVIKSDLEDKLKEI